MKHDWISGTLIPKVAWCKLPLITVDCHNQWTNQLIFPEQQVVIPVLWSYSDPPIRNTILPLFCFLWSIQAMQWLKFDIVFICEIQKYHQIQANTAANINVYAMEYKLCKICSICCNRLLKRYNLLIGLYTVNFFYFKIH